MKKTLFILTMMFLPLCLTAQEEGLEELQQHGSDDALRLSPPKILSLEQALEFIDTDELLEITPETLRIRKKILDPTLRKRAAFARKNEQ